MHPVASFALRLTSSVAVGVAVHLTTRVIISRIDKRNTETLKSDLAANAAKP